MVELCPVCNSELVFFSSDFASTRYFCSECKSFHSIPRSITIEERIEVSKPLEMLPKEEKTIPILPSETIESLPSKITIQRPVKKKTAKTRKKIGIKKMPAKSMRKKKTVKKTSKKMKKKAAGKKK